MKVKNIPLIYNVDKIRLYVDNLFVADTWCGGHGLVWYIENHEKMKEYLDRRVESMAISVEGCLSEVVVLEIFVK